MIRTRLFLRISLLISATLFVLQIAAQPLNASGDPFAEYINSVPRILQALSDDTTGPSGNAVITRRFTFSSRKGINTRQGPKLNRALEIETRW
jgi:hypothetical protein